eukprot:1587706-Amphidinium_carterae.1
MEKPLLGQRFAGSEPVAPSNRGVFGVPEQLSECATDMVLPRQTSLSGVVLDNISAAFEQVGTCSAGE